MGHADPIGFEGLPGVTGVTSPMGPRGASGITSPIGPRGVSGVTGEYPPAQLDIAVLAHHDPVRYRRALVSALETGATSVTPVIDKLGGMEKYLRDAIPAGCRPPHIVEGGGCGKAKNGALDAPFAEGITHRLLLDGDDLLYPCAANSIEADLDNALKKSSRPVDMIGIYGFDTLAGEVWESWVEPPWPKQGKEPGWEAYPYVTAWSAKVWRVPVHLALYNAPDMICYDDGELAYRALRAHLDGRARVTITKATDFYVMERNVPNSNQSDRPMMGLCADAMRYRRLQSVQKECSTPGQLEYLDAREPMMSYQEKLQWLESKRNA